MTEPINDERVAELEQAFGDHSDVRELVVRIRQDAQRLRQDAETIIPERTRRMDAERRAERAEAAVQRVETQVAALDELATMPLGNDAKSALRLAARSIRSALAGDQSCDDRR